MERQWMTLDQIKVEYASNDYSPELLLQHLLHHVEASPASVPEGAFKAWWNSDTESADNPYSEESSIYWAWEGWCAALAAAPTQTVSEDRKDAERYNKLVAYLVSDCTEFDDAIIAARTLDEMNAVIDTMQEEP